MVALAFVLLHAITWFNLTPQAMVVRLRGRRVPPAADPRRRYAGWLVVVRVRALAGGAMMAHPASRTATEPFVWLLFSAGGVVAALFLPVLLLLFGVAIPLGWVDAPDHEHLLAVVATR